MLLSSCWARATIINVGAMLPDPSSNLTDITKRAHFCVDRLTGYGERMGRSNLAYLYCKACGSHNIAPHYHARVLGLLERTVKQYVGRFQAVDGIFICCNICKEILFDCRIFCKHCVRATEV